jgi:hypothetical protein
VLGTELIRWFAEVLGKYSRIVVENNGGSGGLPASK